MLPRILLLTGQPGVGKATVLTKTVETLKADGYVVGGMISREVRENGARIGFEIYDIQSGKRGWLAHVNQKSGPRIGRYHVDIEDLDGFGAQAVFAAVERCAVVVIDEIGPMELFSEKFKDATQKALDSSKLVIAVVHWKARDKLLDAVRKRTDAELTVVTFENREKLPAATVAKALSILKHV